MNEIVSLLTGRVRSTVRDIAVSGVMYGIAAIFALTAYMALLYAAGLAIASEVGPVVAALSIAGATVFLALILLLALSLRRRRLRPARRLRPRGVVATGAGLGLGTVVPLMVRASPVGSLLAVAVLAYVVSRAGQDERRRR